MRYGGHTSCVALAHDADEVPKLVLDAGTGLRRVTGLLGEEAFQGSILLTHLHWDHTHGLPFFTGGDRDGAVVDLFVPEQEDGSSAEAALERGMSPPHFPITPSMLRGEWSFLSLAPGRCRIEGFTVEARDVPHKGGRTFGYRVEDDHSSLCYLPDHCPTLLGPGEEGLGEYHEEALALASGVDVLFHDAVLLPEQVAAEASFGHAACDYAVGLANRTGAAGVVLLHHRHDRTDDELDRLADRLQSAPVPTTVGSERDTFEL